MFTLMFVFKERQCASFIRGGAILRQSTRGRARMGKAVACSILSITAVLTQVTSEQPTKMFEFTLMLNSSRAGVL